MILIDGKKQSAELREELKKEYNNRNLTITFTGQNETSCFQNYNKNNQNDKSVL